MFADAARHHARRGLEPRGSQPMQRHPLFFEHPTTRRELLARGAAGLALVGLAGCTGGTLWSADPADSKPIAAEPTVTDQRHRLIVCTDLTSMQAGVLEPDDAQSLIRLLLHADGIDIEGLLPGSGLNHGHQVFGEAMVHRLIDAYALVQPALVLHDPRYPLASDLHALVHPGQPVADRTIPPERSVGAGLDTPASGHLIRAIDRADPRPLHVALWGGAADIAQALWRIRADRGADGIRTAAARLRVHAIGDQDSTAAWAKATFPEVPWITRAWGYRGMYRGGDRQLVDAAWLQRCILPNGPLCALFPVYSGGDIWSKKLGKVDGIKEGDTPSWLGLIPNGLHFPDHPEWGGWSGRVRVVGTSRWTCDGVVDRLPGDESEPRPEMSTVHRWRAAVQASFAMRARRCVEPPGKVPVEPAVRLNGPVLRIAEPGKIMAIDAGTTRDALGGRLTWRWWIYHQAGTAMRLPKLTATDQSACEVTIPDGGLDGSVHLIGECHPEADPHLTGYARTVLIPPA